MMPDRVLRIFTTVLIALATGACATRNMLPDGAGAKAMLGGNDPVSYQTGPSPARGDPAITAEWDGGLYRFTNVSNRAEFLKSPGRYAPQYGGYCANGAPYSILLGGSADTYKVVDDRLFMFSGPDSKKYWEMDQARNMKLGDEYWASEMKDTSSAFVHSYRRILFKVPHYKTGKELEAEWQARQKK
ncbi:MAG: YHS domain-containing (seleno)protein [Burkholderiales bacterium]